MPILKVSFALLVILANKKLDLIIFDDKVLPIDLLLPKLEDFFKKRITISVYFGSNEDQLTHITTY